MNQLPRIALIGGTGVGDKFAAMPGRIVHVPTNYGMIRAKIAPHEGCELVLLQRHSSGHKVPPHRVNYQGMTQALKALNVKGCIATAAVGSLREDWEPGTFVVCSDFLDYTYRRLTMWDREVKHIDFSNPFDPALRSALLETAKSLNEPIQNGGVYIGGDGPRYESPHEIQVLARDGDLVGMTASSETILMRELGIPYSLLAIVTNLGCGLGTGELNHEEVVDVMQERGKSIFAILLGATTSFAKNKTQAAQK